jgi:gamma-glutamyltranspeptidase/glutathione hydrolase
METPTFGSAAVAAPHDLASQAGLSVLAQGGNAIEAMVAMAATIAVVYPHMNSIGGDGFWLISDARQRVRYIEACGPAGSLATIRVYAEKGYDAIPPSGADAALTVPGAIGGWIQALDMSQALGGRLPLNILLADAISKARDGVPVSGSQGRAGLRDPEGIMAAPGFAAAFTNDGKLLEKGAMLRQPTLAATLEQLAHAGLQDYYVGDVGRELAHDLDHIGSPVTREDFRRYQAVVGAPLRLAIDGGTVCLTPPPTQGLSTGITLGLFNRLGVERAESFEHIHGLIESVKLATLARDKVVTDPAFLTEDPADYLSDRFLAANAASISMRSAATSPVLTGDGDTIWMGAIDKDGLSVSMIQSIFWDFGSGVVLPRTGVLMQNRGMSFSLNPKAKNPLQPGRKPFHTLNPAMALFADGRIMPFGTMGGDAQPQILAQTFSRFRFGQGLAASIDAPRFRLARRWKAEAVMLEMENRFDDALVRRLEQVGHPVVILPEAYEDDLGHSGALIRHPSNGRIEATHDPRSDGGAVGF